MWPAYFLEASQGDADPVSLTTLGPLRAQPGVSMHLSSPATVHSVVAETIKNLPAMQETQVPSLGGEDPLEEGILAWRIPWTEEPGGLQSIGSHRVGHN